MGITFTVENGKGTKVTLTQRGPSTEGLRKAAGATTPAL